VRAGDPLAELHAATQSRLDAGAAHFTAAVRISDEPPSPAPLLLERVGA
jgi:thymidine phosphorylase